MKEDRDENMRCSKKNDMTRDKDTLRDGIQTTITYMLYPIGKEVAKMGTRFKFSVFMGLKKHKIGITKNFENWSLEEYDRDA